LDHPVTYCRKPLAYWQQTTQAAAAIVVNLEEIDLKFQKSLKKFKMLSSSRYTFNHNCYRKSLGIVNIVTVSNCMQYNALQQVPWLTHISIIKVTLQFTKVCKSSSSLKIFAVKHAIIYFFDFVHVQQLCELYFIYTKVHKVQANNKIQKVRTSQLCLLQYRNRKLLNSRHILVVENRFCRSAVYLCVSLYGWR